MSNYNYYRHAEVGLVNRFDVLEGFGEGYRALGLNLWHRYIDMLVAYVESFLREREGEDIRYRILRDLPEQSGETPRSPEEWILLVLLHRLRELRAAPRPNPCPRLFISHRQADKGYALRVAQLAASTRFAFWLDVLDPHLSARPSMPVHLRPLLTACIIEMALLNCSHVIALVTPQSPGSAWIPYEYGRVKEQSIISYNAAAWIHPGLAPRKLPDYMELGHKTFREGQIGQWLDAEYRLAGGPGLGCRPMKVDDHDFDGAEELPEVATAERKKAPANIVIYTQKVVTLMKPLKLKK